MLYSLFIIFAISTIISADPYSSYYSSSQYSSPYFRHQPQNLFDDRDIYIRKTYDRQLSTFAGYGNSMSGGGSNVYSFPYQAPRFGVPELLSSSPSFTLNGYPMYQKNRFFNPYPQMMMTQASIPTYSQYDNVFQGPTVSRLPFKASI